MKILFVGSLWKGSTGLHRLTALQDLGHSVHELDVTPKHKPYLLARTLRYLGFQLDIANINGLILDAAQKDKFDFIWVDKVLEISPDTLNAIKLQLPNCKLIFYSPDDMMIAGNQTRHYRACLPVYDLHVTTKSYNVHELKPLGAQEVFFVDNAYDTYTHRPLTMTKEEKAQWGADVGFIGGSEPERSETMLRLAEAGISVTIRGPGWESYREKHPNLIVEPGWVNGDDYARSICATKINLGFLRKVARDKQTTRSIEIPACGGFMLAERTDEHMRLFVEGKEAEFFGDFDELLKKVQYYLAHDQEREQIAAAGYRRCLESGYSNHNRLKVILEHINTLS